MKRHIGIVLMSLGGLFLLNAVFGRYLVLPGYYASLEQGRATVAGAGQAIGGWKVVRYLIWAYSFKLGIYLFSLGALLRTAMTARRFWLLAAGGFAYIAFAYIPLPAPRSIVFGVGGGLMTILMLLLFSRLARERERLPEDASRAGDYRMIGFFFFAMATYTLCPLMGVKAFALRPEKMIQYGLQQEAASFAYHLLIELVLGWIFLFLGYSGKKRGISAPAA